MLYVLCATTVLAGAAGLVAVAVVLGVMPWETMSNDIELNPFIFATVAGAALFSIAMIQIGLTAIVVGTLGLRIVWRDEDRKERKAQQKGPASTKPAEPNLKPRDQG